RPRPASQPALSNGAPRPSIRHCCPAMAKITPGLSAAHSACGGMITLSDTAAPPIPKSEQSPTAAIPPRHCWYIDEDHLRGEFRMSLAEKVQKDLVDAMRAKDELKLSVLRGVKAAIKHREIEKIRA